MPPISILLKPASGLCNLRCTYCFYADEMRNRSQPSYGIMSLETLENVVRETLSCAEGECTFAFQGGEPTLAGLAFYESFMELENRYNVNYVRVSHAFQTNGYLLDEKWCRFFAQNHFLTGLSVDGIKAAHDAYRKTPEGEDTYFHTLEAARMLEAAGVQFNILTVVNKRTAPKIRRIYENYRKLGFCWQQYIACLDPLGGEGEAKDYSLTAKAYGQFLTELFELWYLDVKKGKQPYIRQFENYIGILLGQAPESCEQRGMCSCQNVVEADGSVYPCDFYVMDSYLLGNLNKDSFAKIWERERELRFVEASKNHPPKCQACPYFALCRGGCRRHREQGGGMSEDNVFCEAYKMFFDACLPGMREIAAAISSRR